MFSRQAVQMDSFISGFFKDINDGLHLGVLKASSSDGCSYVRVGFIKDINEGLYRCSQGKQFRWMLLSPGLSRLLMKDYI